MERQQVRSSNLRSVGYDSEQHILEIEFRNGGLYQYFEVPAERHLGLMQAPSHGRYLDRCIKGRYRFQKIWAHQSPARW